LRGITRANRIKEIAVTQTMVDRVGRRFNLRPQRLAGDTVYGAVRLLKWLVDRKITPHVSVWDMGLGCVKTRCRAKPIDRILHQIAIEVGKILMRGRFRSV
jgi:hypothetical protein